MKGMGLIKVFHVEIDFAFEATFAAIRKTLDRWIAPEQAVAVDRIQSSADNDEMRP